MSCVPRRDRNEDVVSATRARDATRDVRVTEMTIRLMCDRQAA